MRMRPPNLLQWQIKREGCALTISGIGVEAQGAAVLLDNTFCDVEAQAGTLPVPGRWQTDKGPEELVDLCRGDRDTHVVDANMHNILFSTHFYRNGRMFVGVFNGVIEQVAKCLLQAAMIPVSNDGSVGSF